MKIRAWHVSGSRFRRFNPKRSAMGGILWFTEDFDKVVRGEVEGVQGYKYVYEVLLDVSRPAGWKEYDQLMLDQIVSMGYDSIHLDTNWVLFDPSRIEILKVRKIEDLLRS